MATNSSTLGGPSHSLLLFDPVLPLSPTNPNLTFFVRFLQADYLMANSKQAMANYIINYLLNNGNSECSKWHIFWQNCSSSRIAAAAQVGEYLTAAAQVPGLLKPRAPAPGPGPLPRAPGPCPTAPTRFSLHCSYCVPATVVMPSLWPLPFHLYTGVGLNAAITKCCK